MMMLKVTQKQSFVLSSVSVFFELYSLGKAWVFLIELVFCQISNLSFYLSKNQLRKNR